MRVMILLVFVGVVVWEVVDHSKNNLTVEMRDKLVCLNYALDRADFKPDYKIVDGHHYRWISAFHTAIDTLSCHFDGTAVDVSVQDINDDGIVNDQDADDLFRVLEQMDRELVIKGNIGLYYANQNRPQAVVHFDVTGGKRRWKQR